MMTPSEKISRARAGLILSEPFFATLAMGLEVVEAPEIKTMATDGDRLFYKPEFVDSLPSAQLRGVVAHEVMHVALLHHVRRGNRDPGKWNEAADHAINLELLAKGFDLPPGRLADSKFAGMGAEAIYAAIMRDNPSPQGQSGAQKPQAGQQGPQGPQDGPQGPDGPQAGQASGQGAGGQSAPDPGGCGGVMDAAPAHDAAAMKAAEMKAKTRVIQAATVAKAAGNCPDFAAAMVEDIRAPQVDWRTVLRRFVDESARRDFSWTRPNRRHIAAGLYLPGTVPDGLSRLGIIWDVSGSACDPETQAAFMGEVQGAVDDVAPDSVVVVQWNKREVARQEFGQGEPIEVDLQRGGGTDLRGCFDALGDTCAAVLVFTDMEWPAERWPADPGAPVLWAKWGKRQTVAPYGETIAL